MSPVEAASVVRYGRIGGDFIAQRRYIAAGLVLAQEVERLEGELQRARDEGARWHRLWDEALSAFEAREGIGP